MKLSENKYSIGAGLLILALAFYWYSYRPSEIKKKCFDIAGHIVPASDYDLVYKSCLNKNGL